jgi:quercetin dioxygenase-like cupin family protein
MNDLFAAFENGTIACPGKTASACDAPWNDHAAFAGVALKHLVTGADTDGLFSVHLVRLDPDAEIGIHSHDASWELHEVAAGSGQCLLDGQAIDYAPGVAAVLPQGAPHSVRAGRDGLRLLAKFVPALL